MERRADDDEAIDLTIRREVVQTLGSFLAGSLAVSWSFALEWTALARSVGLEPSFVDLWPLPRGW